MLVLWRPWALAYSCDQPSNFSCPSAVLKNGHLGSYFWGLEYHLASKTLYWPAMSVSNKKQEFEQRKQMKLLDDSRVHANPLDFASGRRLRARLMQTVKFVAFNFWYFFRTAWLLPCSTLFRFCNVFFLILFVHERAKQVVTFFF